MKIALGQLRTSEAALAKLSQEALPIMISYKLTKFLKAASKELAELEANRDKLVRQFGVEDSEQGRISVPQEKLEDFMKELEPLLLHEVDFEFEKIQAGTLPDTVKISPSDLILLEPFIQFE